VRPNPHVKTCHYKASESVLLEFGNEFDAFITESMHLVRPSLNAKDNRMEIPIT
jgi:hypothetical protein